jgi:quercetin dioxygenase-like cupin family protein
MIKVLLRSEETSDAIGLVENTVPAGWDGPPLHHHSFDETFYVLDGELTFQLGDEIRTAGPGDVVFAAGGSVHTLANLGDREARYLIAVTPGGFERYFDRLAAKALGVDPPATAAKGYPETTVVGPHIRERLESERA